MKKDMVFGWWPNGFNGNEKEWISIYSSDYAARTEGKELNEFYNIQTPVYATSVRPYEAKLGEISVFEKQSVNFSFDLTVNGKKFKRVNVLDKHSPSRLIDSCPVCVRKDILSLDFDCSVYGCLEFSFFKRYFVIKTDLISENDCSAKGGFTLKCDKVLRKKARAVLACIGGSLFGIYPLNAEDIVCDGENISISSSIELEANTYKGFSVAVVPIEKEADFKENKFKLIEELALSCEEIFPGKKPHDIVYDKNYGYIKVNAGGTFSYDYSLLKEKTNRAKLDRLVFSLKNNAKEPVDTVLVFERNSDDDFNPTGMCPVIRSCKSGRPTGIPMYRTNNWHCFDENEKSPFFAKKTDLRRKNLGIWYKAFTEAEVPAKGEYKHEYTCTYAEWGNAYAVSHAQLCLIGYAGNQLWDQSALGCFGETICYDPDVNLGRSMIDDVRPFLTDCGEKYNWGGNIGGGEFLEYRKDGRFLRLKNVKTIYEEQGPNMTDVIYTGESWDDAIKAEINIRMGRTDDIPRIYYKLKYEFLKDVEADTLFLFRMGAANYANGKFEKLAFGTDNGVIENGDGLSFVGKKIAVNARNTWVMYYKNDSENEYGSEQFIIREYKAVINGEEKEYPCVEITETNDRVRQPSAAITFGTNRIKRGSYAEILLEYDILPDRADKYYGESEYMLLNRDYIGTANAGIIQAKENVLSLKTLKGEQKNVYPPEIAAESSKNGSEALFVLSGGAGYTPIVIDGADSSDGYALFEVKGNDEIMVDQSKYGNDFWQCSKKQNGRYRFVYNVKNGGNRIWRFGRMSKNEESLFA